MIKTRKSMRVMEQQTTDISEYFINTQPKNQSVQIQNRKTEKLKNINFPKLDQTFNKDPFLNTLKLTILDLVQNFDYMDPNDVTFQLNQMVKQKSFIQQSKPFYRIHQRSMPKHRNTNKQLFDISRTTRID